MPILKFFVAVVLFVGSLSVSAQAEDNVGENLGRLLDQLPKKDEPSVQPDRKSVV